MGTVKKKMKKILIIDDHVFTQVCRAILELEGYQIVAMKRIMERLLSGNGKDIGLIITSYPYCIPLLRELKEVDMPKIILFDHLDKEVITLLKGLRHSFCMIKPINYDKLRSLVKSILAEKKPVPLNFVSIL